MGMIHLKASAISGDTSTVMVTDGSLANSGVNVSPGFGGILQSVSIVSSADTSVAVTIADATGTVFTIGSTDFTTRVNYRGNNAAIVRDAVKGQLTATTTGSGSGTVTVDAWVWVD